MPSDTDKDSILGALLWLRNHYDLGGSRDHRVAVLKRIDKMLETNKVGLKHLDAFQKHSG